MQIRFDVDLPGPEDELITPGILSCQGCGAALAMKFALAGLGRKSAVVIPACCWGIIAGVYPCSALKVPVVHVPFATAAAVASGIRAGLDARGEDDAVVMAWAGDGGTFDIGLQALSGAAERNENICYVCYDNEAYMNTGIQRSSATPPGAWTTTTPKQGPKIEPKKDIEKIMRAHRIPYLATASIAYPDDMVRKFKKARKIRGFRFIRVLAPCPPGWKFDSSLTVSVARKATQANIFPLWESEGKKVVLNFINEDPLPVTRYLEVQGRFKEMDEELISQIQKDVDEYYDELVEEGLKEV